MKFGSVGAVIAAASKKDAVPLLKVGSIPIVRRIVLTLQQAGVFPIVVVTGTEELEVTHQVAPLGVVFIKNTECEKPELFSSVKLGLSYLQGKCDRVVFTPVNAPMFFAQTLHTLLSCDADIVTPTYDGRGGHPICCAGKYCRRFWHTTAPMGCGARCGSAMAASSASPFRTPAC